MKSAPKLNIDELCADPRIRKLDAELRNLARESTEKIILSEAEVSQLPIENLSIHDPLFHQYSCPSLPEALAELRSRPSAYECLQRVWDRSFKGEAFAGDVEALASKLLGEDTRIRDFDVAAQDRISQKITAIYPSALQVQAGLPVLENLINEPCCELPFLSAFIMMVYFYRLHPLPDGNGRTSRAMINICLRKYGLIEEPCLLISPLLTRYLPQIEPMIRKGADDPNILFILLLNVAKRSLTLAWCNNST